MQIHRVIFLAVLLATASSTSAQTIPDLLQQMEAYRYKTCTLKPESVDALLDQMGTAKSLNEKFDGLQYLTDHIGWRAKDHSTAPQRLNQIAKGSGTLALMAAQALASADGELHSATRTFHNNRDGFESYLAQLIKNNQDSNPFYLAYIKVTLAETLQDWVFQDLADVALPYSSDAAAKSRLSKSVSLYEELAAFYAQQQKVSQLFARDVSLDFSYQIALLRFAIGDASWRQTLQSIIDDEGGKNPYADGNDGRHIYVYSFLRPPRAEVQTQVQTIRSLSKKSCADQDLSHPTGKVDFFSPAIVKSYFNPVQLSLWTCQVLATPPSPFTVHNLGETLATFKNHDYRVVLGHFSKNEVKYSHFDLAELEERAGQLSLAISQQFTPKSPLAPILAGACTQPQAYDPLETHTTLAKQASAKNKGYLYIGDGLEVDDAKVLLELVQSDEDFSNAYLIRPRIE